MIDMPQKGFTLIETLVYLALFSIIIGGLIAASYMLFETSDRNQTKAMMQEEENFLIAKINWALSGASSVSVPSANSSGSTLTVTKYDGTSFTINRSGTDLIMNFTPLNNTNVAISKLVFIHTYAGGTNPESVEAGFTISAQTPTGGTIFETASTTSYVRK